MAEVKVCISVRVFETLYVLQSVHGEVVFCWPTGYRGIYIDMTLKYI